MKQLKTYLLALAGMVMAVACNNEKEAASTKSIEIAKVETILSDYSIPQELEPVSNWKEGYSAEETMKFRQAYEGKDAVLMNDVGNYGTLHLSEILPTAVVSRDGAVSELESAPMPKIGQVGATTDLGTMTLEQMMNDPRARFKGIAVVHDGKLVYEKYLGLEPQDISLWASSSKSLVGILAHQFNEEGLIDFAAPISDYLTELKGTAWENVPADALLHQRSGLDIGEGNVGNPEHPITLFYAIMTGVAGIPEGAKLTDAAKLAVKIAEPGEIFEYSSMNTYLLGTALERIASKPIHKVISERIWAKAGMEGDGLLTLSPGGEPSIQGLFGSRLRDFARYGMLYTPSWNIVSEEQVVSDDYFEKVYAASKPELMAGNNIGDRMAKSFGETGMGESYQWDAVFADGDLYKSGRNGQCLYISPETNTVVVWFSSAYNNTLWVNAYAREIVKQVFRN